VLSMEFTELSLNTFGTDGGTYHVWYHTSED
jgi:hypothetical protein